MKKKSPEEINSKSEIQKKVSEHEYSSIEISQSEE